MKLLKKITFLGCFVSLAIQCTAQESTQVKLDKDKHLITLKNNFKNDGNISKLISNLPEQGKQDFDNFLNEIWLLVNKVAKQGSSFKDNSLIKKYLELHNVERLFSFVTFEVKNATDYFTHNKSMPCEKYQKEMQSLYKLLSPQEKAESKHLITDLNAFIANIETDFNQIVGRYAPLKKSMTECLKNSEQVFILKIGCVVPFIELVMC